MQDVVISEVQIIPVKPQGGLVAFASCVVNDQFYVGDIAVYTRPNGQDYRLVYPCKVLPNGKRINCFHPINREVANHLTEAIVSTFRGLTEKVKKTRGRREFGIGTEG